MQQIRNVPLAFKNTDKRLGLLNFNNIKFTRFLFISIISTKFS